MKEDLVSVILPVYNAEETLEEAAGSIIEQTLDRWELLLVDDGSGDGSREIIRRLAGEDRRIRPLYRAHEGLVPALNAGLKSARGNLVARMDADDRSLPERLEQQKKLLEERPRTGLVSCLVRHWGDKKKKAGYARYVDWVNSLTDPDEIALNRFIESPLAHPSVMFRASLAQNFGGYREGPFPEDYELWLRWLEKGVRMRKVPEVLLHWRDEPGRLSRTDDRYSFQAFYRLKARYLARWLSRNNPHHPDVVIWGAGRTTRRRAEMLCDHGIRITHYVDIDPNKIGHEIHGRPVWSADDLPPPSSAFVVSYVARHGANRMIGRELESRGYRPGDHFLFAA